eukprot:TRINITY_DN32937_c0_g1_i1.p2 TRINITY_DN32937_c0_g1~~TRINITY_DN32937_c0_g1_i1.p2  ORF type:complete len:145 (+),score=54.08 TRINITY_DN32937_c0_g1_i1:60-494(+)
MDFLTEENLKKVVSEAFKGENVFIVVTVTLVVAALIYHLLTSKSISASHILVKTDAEAQCIYRELEKRTKAGEATGAVFGDLAAKHSLCPSGKQGGGSLGSFSLGDMDPIFEQQCLTNPIGQPTKPFATGFGTHLILVHARSGC